jgi:hypothetical protein
MSGETKTGKISIAVISTMLLYVAFSGATAFYISNIDSIRSRADWGSKVWLIGPLEMPIWGAEWFAISFATLVATLLSTFVGTMLDADKKIDGEFAKNIRHLFSDATLLQLALAIIVSFSVFSVSEIFSLTYLGTDFHNNYNLVRWAYETILRNAYTSWYLVFLNLILISSLFLLILLPLFFVKGGKFGKTSRVKSKSAKAPSLSAPAAAWNPEYERIMADEYLHVAKDNAKRIDFRWQDFLIVIALMLNNYFLAPSLEGSYAEYFTDAYDYNLLLAIVAQILALIFMYFFLRQAKKISNVALVDYFGRRKNDKRLQASINPRYLYAFVVAIFSCGILIAVLGGSALEPVNTSFEKGAVTSSETQIAALSCTMVIGNPSSPYTDDLGGHWSKNSSTRIDTGGIDVSNCNLTQPLTNQQNFVAIIATSSQDDDGNENASLAEERARSLASSILSKSPGWRGRSIIVNLGKAMPQGVRPSTGDIFSYQRPVIVITGHAPIKNQSPVSAANDDWAQNFGTDASIPDAKAAYVEALNVIVHTPPKPLFNMEGCSFAEVKLSNDQLDTEARHKCFAPPT